MIGDLRFHFRYATYMIFSDFRNSNFEIREIEFLNFEIREIEFFYFEIREIEFSILKYANSHFSILKYAKLNLPILIFKLCENVRKWTFQILKQYFRYNGKSCVISPNLFSYVNIWLVLLHRCHWSQWENLQICLIFDINVLYQILQKNKFRVNKSCKKETTFLEKCD